jgi:alkylation response protein AidB-like acyl-CoA dehydrogenase
MDLSYSEEHERFRAELRDFLEKNRDQSPVAGGMRSLVAIPDEKVRGWQRLLIEHGYAARTIPREYGGYGAEPDPLKTVIIDEEFSRARLPGGIGGQGPDMLVPTLLEHGTEAQRQRWIPPTIRGEVVWCQGYSEQDAGSDLASLRTRADEDGDDFVINGQKIWTSGAQISDMMFVLVRTDPDAGKHAGLSYLLLPMETPGIEIRPLKTMTGGAEFNQVFFTDVRVPKENLVGERGGGWKVANTTLRHERNMLGSASQSYASLQRLVEVMQTRRADGSAAIDDPVLRDRLLRLQGRVEALRHHSMRLLTCAIRRESPGVAGMLMKLYGCEINHQLARLAIDAMAEGGTLYGPSERARASTPWQFQSMFSLGLIIGGGTAQIQKNIISERGLGLPREPRPAATEKA